MNLAKHMEAVLLSVFALIAATGVATAAVPAHKVAPVATVATVAAPASAPMQVVTIVGKRQPR